MKKLNYLDRFLIILATLWLSGLIWFVAAFSDRMF